MSSYLAGGEELVFRTVQYLDLNREDQDGCRGINSHYVSNHHRHCSIILAVPCTLCVHLWPPHTEYATR